MEVHGHWLCCRAAGAQACTETPWLCCSARTYFPRGRWIFIASQLAQGSSRSSTPSSPGVCWRTAPYSAESNVLPLLGCTRTNDMFPTETALEAGSKVYGEYHIQLQLHRSLQMGCQYTHGFLGRIQACSLYSFQKLYGLVVTTCSQGAAFCFTWSTWRHCLVTPPGLQPQFTHKHLHHLLPLVQKFSIQVQI